MRTLLIDPKNQTITEHEHNGDWQTIAPTIDAHNFDVIFTDYGDIYVDDEGLMNSPEHFWMLDGLQPIAGKALVFGNTDDEGDSTPAFATAAELREKIRFLTVDDVREMFV